MADVARIGEGRMKKGELEEKLSRAYQRRVDEGLHAPQRTDKARKGKRRFVLIRDSRVENHGKSVAELIKKEFGMVGFAGRPASNFRTWRGLEFPDWRRY